MKQIINILIIDDSKNSVDELYLILRSPGNNIFIANSEAQAYLMLTQKKFALILCSADIENLDFYEFINQINSTYINDNTFIIAMTQNSESVLNLIKGMQNGIIDYLLKPYNANLVKAKINIYKRLYFKNNRISNLLENILPKKTINEFKKTGKATPKKYNNCTVIFTDFVNFSEKATSLTPKELITQLDYYFTKFDEIIQRYQLEKIKTIGDAYMAVGGVNDSNQNIELKTALAALEIRNFMANEILLKKALGQEFWDIRIGIHSGNLIAGVIGSYKFSFDVWGDTVNVAARCEQNSETHRINISETFYNSIKTYFNFTSRGAIDIKNRGKINMYFLDSIIDSYSLKHDGLKANGELRQLAGLSAADYIGLRSFIISKLKAELSEDLFYHSIDHTLNVELAVQKYAKLEGLSDIDTLNLRIAALFHDSGFLIKYDDNEEIGVKVFNKYAPDFGFNTNDLKTISVIILATNNKIEPITLSEKIMCDADHDYLGRQDYHHVAQKLNKELSVYKTKLSSDDWVSLQIEYLEKKHKYYTTSAYNLRQQGKEKRIAELKRYFNKQV
jgi:class 3 adenylate cyclase/HD superfamily phosphodiesterase/ActR/RegA family two-component response regulator